MNQNLPKWMKRKLQANPYSFNTKKILKENNLSTVCEEAACPNRNECYSRKVATFLILGKTCSRNCSFCNVEHSKLSVVDIKEPMQIAKTAKQLKLKCVVITSVTRDDLEDEGASHFANCIKSLRQENPNILIEVLTPDFNGDKNLLEIVLSETPTVFNHNVETIERLYKEVRPAANYKTSLSILKAAKKFNDKILIKSGIMVGLGEDDSDVLNTMQDIRNQGTDIITIGQYLRPSTKHHEVKRFVHPNIFETYKKEGKKMGFKFVASGPYIRSSYFAEEILDEINL